MDELTQELAAIDLDLANVDDDYLFNFDGVEAADERSYIDSIEKELEKEQIAL